jgi:N-acetylglucosamine-6-sulfatase
VLIASIFSLLLIILSLDTHKKAEAQGADKPNIVFIMSDDQPQSTIKAMDNVRTRIRDAGLNANNFYVSQSLCCPSRASILKGQYPHNTGIQKNGPPGGGEPEFRAIDDNTVATQLSNRGYQTGFVGKYMNEYTCPYKPPGWGYWYAKDDVSVPGEGACENGNMIDYTGDGGNWGDRIGTKAEQFLNRNTDQASDGPFALFMWTSQPHLTATG